MGVNDFTVYSIIKRNGEMSGDRVGWKFNEESLTHKEFKKRVDQLACGLSASGIKKGDRVGILGQNSLEYLYLYGASARIGAIAVPINWRLKHEEVAYILTDCSPKIMFVDDIFQELVPALKEKSGNVEHWYSFCEAGEGLSCFQKLMENDGDIQTQNNDVASNDAFAIIYTAAVNGKPKGAVLTHNGVNICNIQVMNTWNLDENSCHLTMLPLFHMAALGTCLQIAHAGGMNIIMKKFDPDEALTGIQECKVTHFLGFPPMLGTMLERNKEMKCDLKSLEMVSGIEPPDVVRKVENMTGARFWTVYGQTETTSYVVMAPFLEKCLPGGWPCPMVDIEVWDESGNALPRGYEGEIVVRGPQVFQGYWNLPEESDHVFRNGWLHTGDKGSFHEDGYLCFLGRMPEKELIKSGGENVYPVEVERAILENPNVEAAIVIGVPDNEWGEAIKAVCVLRKGKAVSESELIDFVASKIARFKKPRFVEFVSGLPVKNDGSVDREMVRNKYGLKGV